MLRVIDGNLVVIAARAPESTKLSRTSNAFGTTITGKIITHTFRNWSVRTNATPDKMLKGMESYRRKNGWLFRN